MQIGFSRRWWMILLVGLALPLWAETPAQAPATSTTGQAVTPPVLCLTAPGWGPQQAELVAVARRAGRRVVFVSLQAGPTPGAGGAVAVEATALADVTATPEHFSALLLADGLAAQALANTSTVWPVVRAFVDAGRPVAAPAEAAQILREAKAVGPTRVVAAMPAWQGVTDGPRRVPPTAAIVDGALLTGHVGLPTAWGELLLPDPGQRTPPVASATRPVAWLALQPGFDEAVVLGLRPWLAAQGFQIEVVAFAPGWVPSLGGTPLAADWSYAAHLPPSLLAPQTTQRPLAVVVLPGGLADFAATPEAQAARRQWVAVARSRGYLVVAAGADAAALRLPAPTPEAPVATAPGALAIADATGLSALFPALAAELDRRRSPLPKQD